MTGRELIDKLNSEKQLSFDEWKQLIASHTDDDAEYAASIARDIATGIFGKKIYFRGIVEFTNICKNDCIYCGIRKSNKNVARYRLSDDDILECCREGYECGFRTFVLQGGEDMHYTDERLVALIKRIKGEFTDCAVTLSVGERERASYEKLFAAGADRYLLRHETADEAHYGLLHPSELKWAHRMQCLRDLREIGFQTGCGMMVGSPFQTVDHLAKDMMFIKEFDPQMVGMGPFIPHHDTPFRDEPAGSADLTIFLLSLVRIMLPSVLLPATTALGTLSGDGRQRGVLAGCNVIMPNLSPLSVRKKYMLYDNKVGTGDSAADGIEKLRAQMNEIGYEVCVGRGDYKEEK